MNYRSIATCLLASITAASSAQAEAWKYTVTPYLWAPSLETTLDTGPNPPVTGDQSLLEVIDGALLVQAEARRGRWSFLGEFNYLNLSDDFGIAPNDPIAEWRVQGTMIALAAGYAIHETDDTRVEAIGGLRAWDLETSTTVLDARVSKESHFIDPLLGMRVETAAGRHATFEGLATIGGSSFGSDRQIEAMAQFVWPWRGKTEVAVGYRYLSLDFDDGGALIDTTLQGPFVSIGFNF